MPITKNPLAPNPNEKPGDEMSGKGSDVNGGVPSNEEDNWARDNGTTRTYGGRRDKQRGAP